MVFKDEGASSTAYLLALDALDVVDEQFSTRRQIAGDGAGGRIENQRRCRERGQPPVHHARATGVENVDYCILNEIEAGKTAGFAVRTPTDGWTRWRCGMRQALCCSKACANSWSSIFPKALARNRRGTDVWQPALKLPARYIAGTARGGCLLCRGFVGTARRLGFAARLADGRLSGGGFLVASDLHGRGQIAFSLTGLGEEIRLSTGAGWGG